MRSSDASATAPVYDLVITADRRVLIAAANGVREYDASGGFVRTLAAIGSGGLLEPSALFIRSASSLLVCDRAGNRVLEYNLTTGAFIGTFIGAGSGGLAAPMGITKGPNGNFFVTSETTNQVLQYNGTTGALVGVFVAAGSGGLSAPKGLLFKPTDGALLVASYGTNAVLEYNGTTGAFSKTWSIIGVHFVGPWCLRIGREGQVYVSINVDDADTHLTRAKIHVFDIRTGNFVRAYVQALDSIILQVTGFDFMPGDATDCNRNQRPDSCDIAQGFSADINNNGKPDECERTCYANCDLSTGSPMLTGNDFQCFLNAYVAGLSYANCDGVGGLTGNDFQCFINQFAAGCP
jgi:DNA-binding beta-propeller fold protein YncE